ncbi:hypothetical protein [Sneathia sanguinegens]|uniref:hypothetical protein n=1 Tax=Sneathia sanguinegens TaxID=40543 RepID=UPI000834451A|nr:hypothetical protein [Sneathia sanguinegens]
MKKIILLCTLIAGLTVQAKKLPVSIELGLETGYTKEYISKKSFDTVGLKNIFDKEYKANAMITKANIDIKYPIKLKYFNIKLGGGIAGFITNKVANESFVNNDEEYKKYIDFEKDLLNEQKNLEDLYEKLANTKYLCSINAEKLEYEVETNLPSLKRNLAQKRNLKTKIENAIKKYPTKEAVKQLNEAQKKAEKDVDYYQDKKDKLFQEMQGILAEASKYSTNPNIQKIIKDEDEKTAEKRLKKFNEKEKKDIRNFRKKYQDKKNERDNVARKSAEASRKKLELLDELMLADDGAEKLANCVKNIAEIEQKITKSNENIENYKKDKKIAKEEKTKLNKEKESLEEKLNTKLEESKKFDKKKLENIRTYEKAYDILNKELGYGFSSYGVAEIEYQVLKDLKVFANTKLGFSIKNNQLNKLCNILEKEEAIVDGEKYTYFNKEKVFKIDPLFNVGVGLDYKHIIFELNSGNNGLINLKLAYEF